MDDQPMLNLRKAAIRWIVMTSEGDYPAMKRLVEIEIEEIHGKVPHAVAVALRRVTQSHDTQEIDGLLHALAEGAEDPT